MTITLIADTQATTVTLSAETLRQLDALIAEFHAHWPNEQISRPAYLAASLAVWIDADHERLLERQEGQA